LRHLDVDDGRFHTHVDMNGRIRFSVKNGIADQVREHLLQPIPIPVARHLLATELDLLRRIYATQLHRRWAPALLADASVGD
jgi:hypothetical protein